MGMACRTYHTLYVYVNFLPKIDGGHFKDLEMDRRKLPQKQMVWITFTDAYRDQWH